jgi:hypothetical protein
MAHHVVEPGGQDLHEPGDVGVEREAPGTRTNVVTVGESDIDHGASLDLHPYEENVTHLRRMIRTGNGDTQYMNHGRNRTNVVVIPFQRTSTEQVQVQADDQLIEDLRSGRITDSSPVHPVVRLLARWRRSLLTVS